MALGVRSRARNKQSGRAQDAWQPVGCVDVGHVLLVHLGPTPNPGALAVACRIAPDPEHTVVVMDLPTDTPIELWQAAARLIGRRRGSFRLVWRGQSREARVMTGQWLAERLGRIVVASDGEPALVPGGGLFVPPHAGQGWVRYQRGGAAAGESRYFPRARWACPVVDRMWQTGLNAIAEPVPGGVWLRAMETHPRPGMHWRALVTNMPSERDRLTVVLGYPGAAPLALGDIALWWVSLPVAVRQMVRFVQYGRTEKSPELPLGHTLAAVLGEEVAFYNGLPAANGDIHTVGADGTLGWRPYAREVGYGSAGVSRVLTHRPPLPGACQVAPGVYWFSIDTVVEVVPSGLWLRPAVAPPDAGSLRAVPANPFRPIVAFHASAAHPGERMQMLARDLVSRLEPAIRQNCWVLPASSVVRLKPGEPGFPTTTAMARPTVGATPRLGHSETINPTALEMAALAAPTVDRIVTETTERLDETGVQPTVVLHRIVMDVSGDVPPAGGDIDLSPSPKTERQADAGQSGSVLAPVEKALKTSEPPQRLQPAAPSAIRLETAEPNLDFLAAPNQIESRITTKYGGSEPLSGLAEKPAAESQTRTNQDNLARPVGHLADLGADRDGQIPIALPASDLAANDPPDSAHRAELSRVEWREVSPAPTVSAVSDSGTPSEITDSVAEPATAEAAGDWAPDLAAAQPVAVGDIARPIRDGAVPQPMPAAKACAVPPKRGLDRERNWLRRTLGQQYDTDASVVSRVLSEVPGLRAGQEVDQVVCDLVAVRTYLALGGRRLEQAVRTAQAGPHVPLARCVTAGLLRLPTHRGASQLRVVTSEAQLAWYGERRVVTEWAFLRADTAGGLVADGEVEFRIWSMTARRTALLDPTNPSQVVFGPGTSFKVLRMEKEPRPVVLLRELARSEIDEDGGVGTDRVPLDDLALRVLEEAGQVWELVEARGATGPRASAPPGLMPVGPTEPRSEGTSA